MIVSHRHRLIFLKPRKVAGTSFEIALSRYAGGPRDIITPITSEDEQKRAALGFSGPRNHLFKTEQEADLLPASSAEGPSARYKFYNHMAAAEAKQRLPAEVWRSFQRVTIIRNPWDRLVSLFFWEYGRRGAEADLSVFARYFLDHPDLLTHNQPIYLIDGEDVIHRYLRYERIAADLDELEKTDPSLGGFADLFGGISTKASHRRLAAPTIEIFRRHPEVNELVERNNRWEIEKFGYRLADAG